MTPRFLSSIGNDVALDQLIASENHARGEFIQAARIFQNVGAIVVGKRRAVLERREIEQIDIGKTPELIFTRW